MENSKFQVVMFCRPWFGKPPDCIRAHCPDSMREATTKKNQFRNNMQGTLEWSVAYGMAVHSVELAEEEDSTSGPAKSGRGYPVSSLLRFPAGEVSQKYRFRAE